MDSCQSINPASQRVVSIQSTSGSIFHGCSFDTHGGDINIGRLPHSSRPNEADPRPEETRKEIMRWLSVVQYRKHHQRVSKILLRETGQWLFAKPEFKEWYNAKGSAILWLHGIPGCGKTCLMSIAINKFVSERAVKYDAPSVAYFFCSRNTGEGQLSDPTEVLSSVLKQLLCSLPGKQQLESCVANDYYERRARAEADASDVDRLDAREITDHIIQLTREISATIFIDALDECDPSRRHWLTTWLDQLLLKAINPVKVMISSREDTSIVLKLQKSPNIYISVKDNAPDIRRFVMAEVQQAIDLGRLLNGRVDESLQRQIIGMLVVKSNGMFLWASLQIRNLCDNCRIKVPADLKNELEALPDSLGDIYSSILRSIGQIKVEGRKLAEGAIRWLLCTKDPTYKTSIAFLKAKKLLEDDILALERIIDVCCNLVAFDSSADAFHFVHLSVREYLEAQPEFSPSASQAFVLEGLLASSFKLRPTVSHLLDSYALYYWPFHYGKSGEHRAKIFDSYVKHFMFDGATINDRYTQWAQRFLCHDHRGTQLWSRSGEIAFVVDTTGHPPGDVMDPVHLACCNGWLEVLEHYQQNEDQDNFSNAARKMYKAATEYGQIGVVEWLLRSDIRPTNKEIRKMFQHKKEEIIRALFDHNILTVNDPIDGEPPLIMAIQTPCQSIVEYLLEKGADVNCQDPQRRTPLYHAVMVDAVQLVGFLLDIGANPEIANKDGVTPLKLSIQRQGQIASRMMLETGWYDGMMPSDGEDLLRFALECGSYYTACVLLIHNVDPLLHEEGIREQWMTLLSSLDVIRRASSKRQNDPLRVTVLLFGAILPEDVVSQTLLSIAAQLHHKKAFEVLLDMGVDPACPDIRKISKDPKVAAFIGSDVSGHIQYQQHGLDNSSNDWRELIDELRQGPIAWAALNGNVSLVKLILDQGLDPNITNRKGETVLFFATQQFGNFHSQRMVARDKESIVRSLLEQGAFVNTPKLGSEVLIRNSLLGGYENLVTLLMNSGAEMPSRRANGELDPVLEAFHLGQKGILENLQGRMARHKAQDSGGATQTHLGNGQADDSLALITRLIFRGTMNLLADEKATGMLHGK